MNKSSTRGIFLSITLLFSIVLIVIPLNVYAEEINVKSFAFEETTIIEFTNDSDEGVNTFRIWLGSDFSFKSFKTEKGWVGEKTPLGVIIFTSSETIKPGESVKFGVKTDKAKVGINWKALDKRDSQILKVLTPSFESFVNSIIAVSSNAKLLTLISSAYTFNGIIISTIENNNVIERKIPLVEDLFMYFSLIISHLNLKEFFLLFYFLVQYFS